MLPKLESQASHRDCLSALINRKHPFISTVGLPSGECFPKLTLTYLLAGPGPGQYQGGHGKAKDWSWILRTAGLTSDESHQVTSRPSRQEDDDFPVLRMLPTACDGRCRQERADRCPSWGGDPVYKLNDDLICTVDSALIWQSNHFWLIKKGLKVPRCRACC